MGSISFQSVTVKHKNDVALRVAAALAIATAVSPLGAGVAMADSNWNGGTSNDWNTGANWSNNPPTGNFTINTSGSNHPVLNADSAFVPTDVLVGDGAGTNGLIDQTGGTVSLLFTGADDSQGNWYMVGVNNGTGTANFTGNSSINAGKLQIGGAYYRPGGTGTATINTTGVMNLNSTASFGYIFGGSSYASIAVGVSDFGTTNNGTGTLNIQNGVVNARGETHIGSHGGTGTLNMTGGTLNTTGLVIARWRGTGTINVTNATINTGFANLTQAGGINDTETGTLNVNAGGTVNAADDVIVAFAGKADSVGTLNVATGGTLNVGTTSERWLIVSQYDGLKGVVNVDGGTINLNGNTDMRFSTGGNTGPGVVNLNSGTITGWEGNGSASGASTSTVVDLNLSGGDAVNNTFNLNGGTLTVNQVISSSAAGTKTFNFNGGTLKAAGNSDTFMAGLSNAYVLNGGAKIDTNGHDVTISQAMPAGLNSTGGLTKIGTGTLTLTGVNGYVGTTVVQAGTLKANYSSVLATASTPLLTGGGVDLQNTGRLQLDYTGDTSPVAQIKAILDSEAPNGFTAGKIKSTVRPAGTTLGYGDNGAGLVTVRITYAGDSDLDGDVDFNDFLALQSNFGGTNTRFDQGNYNYDGSTNFNDFLALQSNFGKSLAGDSVAFTKAQVAAITAFGNDPTNQAVPEPAALALLGLGGLMLGRRRAGSR